MKNKIGDILNTRKKKAGVAVIGGALALMLGTGAVFADSPSKEKVLAKVENGVKTFSTDNGKTWKSGTPEGFNEKMNKDGSMTSTVRIPPKDGKGLMVQNKNGQIKYSTDGGKTWSENAPKDAPEGLKEKLNKEGSTTSIARIHLIDAKRLMIQNINGKIKYSTDSGKTWSDKAPEGFKGLKNPDGSVSVGM